jgi:dTDP-4-dehydrorhamnose reductase
MDDLPRLVVGGDGVLGAALVDALIAAGRDVVATTRRAPPTPGRLLLDLAAPLVDWPALPRVACAWLCAAVTSQAACERDPQGSWRVNVEQTVALAERLARDGARVVFLSTSQVFDGSRARRTPADPPSPLTEYGRQKAAAEARLRAALGSRLVIARLTKVVAPDAPLFRGWLTALRRGETIRAFTDLRCAPLPLAWVAQALVRLGAQPVAGIVHLSGERDVSYHEAACHLARRLGVDPALVQPGSAVEAGLPAGLRPAHTTLERNGWDPGPGLPWPTVAEAWDSLLAL